MPQRTQKKRRPALQIVSIALAIFMAGCSIAPEKMSPIHPSVDTEAKTLRYRATIDRVGLGSGDGFKRFLVGDDSHDLERPVSIGLRDDIMYIFDAGDGYIFRYSLVDGRMDPMAGVGAEVAEDATDIYVAADHSFYLADIEGRRVLHFDPDGNLIRSYFHGPNISRPVAVSVNEDNGEVFVADEVYSHVVVFNKRGEPLRGIGGRGEGPGKFRIITDMIKTADGFYLSDRIELSVQVLDNEGRYLTHFGEGQLIFPTALTVDNFGRVYVSEKNESIIKVFQQGKLIDVIGSNGYGRGEFRFVSDMKVHKGYLYVADSLNGRVQVFEILPPAKAQPVLEKSPASKPSTKETQPVQPESVPAAPGENPAEQTSVDQKSAMLLLP
ncbi:MAG: hypothetical protein OEZ43_12220 [Gammaproteobacteria bacterium]|nr:hypothetical protein [Gammaproteobacteria bacterium]